MYTILLVEDEKIELETLRDYVKWEKVGIKEVYTARNGRRALEIIESYEPDIIITDIQMPVMSGIELTQRIREEGYTIKIVFLTGYDDFNYVKSAFQVEAVDYILKPFLTEEVETLVLKIIKLLEKEKLEEDSLKLARMQFLENSCTKEEGTSLPSDAFLDNQSEEKGFGLLAVYALEDKNILADCLSLPGVIHVFYIEGMYLVILNGYLSIYDSAHRINHILKNKYTTMFCKETVMVEDLSKQTAWLKRLGQIIFYYEPGVVLEANDLLERVSTKTEVNRALLQKEREELITHITAGRKEEVSNIVEIYVGEMHKLLPGEIKREVYALCLYVYNQLAISEPQQSILKMINFEDVKSYLNSYVVGLADYYSKQQENPNCYVITWVKDYIYYNYTRDCSVGDMAEGLKLSPNYIRSLFKMGTGVTILEFVTEYRLQKSTQLLKDKTLKIKEISALVGYENISYFSQVFMKKYGVSPNEYRKMV